MTNKIAIVAHDAGAANHIFAWLRSGLLEVDNTLVCVDGPAAAICAKLFPELRSCKLEEAIEKASLLVSGTGWASCLEHDARRMAQTKGIHVIAVLDHWSNYRPRFKRRDEEVYPNEVWVVDEFAFDIAKKELPNVNVSLKRNDFIALQLEEINAIKVEKSQSKSVLFLMEPIRQKWGEDSRPGEVQAFDYLVQNMSNIDLAKDDEIVIKPHPSDPSGKYDELVLEYSHLNITIDESSSLSRLIAWSNVVVGCHTYAMVVAVEAGKEVYSALPPCPTSFSLPVKGIIHLSELMLEKNEIL